MNTLQQAVGYLKILVDYFVIPAEAGIQKYEL
jgi:hypothetical protein